MIYFDNAATTKYKPEEVYKAFEYYVREIGVSPGRGSYSLSIEASRMLYTVRKCVMEFFGSADPCNVVFTKNSTEAINLYLRGSLRQGDHVLISPFEHNAVLRPLHAMKEEGIIDYTVIPPKDLYFTDRWEQYITPSTTLAVFTLASNLTGQIVYQDYMGEFLHQKGIITFLDSSQGAGKKLVNMKRDLIDVLAFTGHKDLLALPGVGGICSQIDLRLKPLIQGGTGISGDSFINPQIYPEAYESGTLNMPAIWSLKSGIEYINKNLFNINRQEDMLTAYLIEKLQTIRGIILYNINMKRVSTICFNIKSYKSSDIVEYLDDNQICVRGGIHCAILAHESINTVANGAVRVSLNSFNTIEEINTFIMVMESVGI